MLSVMGTKALALSLMTVITLVMSMLPLYVRSLLQERLKGHKAQIALSGCLCFGGGVLLATVFLHLIPEARFLTAQAMDNHFIPHTNYPLTELVVCLGFFLIYIIEEIVHTCSTHSHNLHQHGNAKKNNPDHLDKETLSLKPVPKDLRDEVIDKQLRQRLVDETDVENNSKEVPAHPVDGSPSTVEEQMSTLKAVVVVVALSFHSIMEGLALGLVHSNRDVWFLFAALLGHKMVIAFCMAMELLEVGVNLIGFLISMIIFSVASPLGGLLGTLIVSLASNESAAGFVTTAVLQGISAGTILYVTFCEVLERERSKTDGGIVRMFAIIIGFICMAVLQIFDDPVMPEGEHLHNITSVFSSSLTTEESI